MSVFDTVKGTVTARQVAEFYGIKVNRNGMCCCPFHNDKNPSMKIDRRYYCFGCGALFVAGCQSVSFEQRRNKNGHPTTFVRVKHVL